MKKLTITEVKPRGAYILELEITYIIMDKIMEGKRREKEGYIMIRVVQLVTAMTLNLSTDRAGIA